MIVDFLFANRNDDAADDNQYHTENDGSGSFSAKASQAIDWATRKKIASGGVRKIMKLEGNAEERQDKGDRKAPHPLKKIQR
jgi:hypothetical protein